jgi:hypothetical protein
MNNPKISERFGSARKPRQYVKPGETYKEAQRRWRARWDDYRDAVIMCECLYQASVSRKKHMFRAFYGLEMRYIVEHY